MHLRTQCRTSLGRLRISMLVGRKQQRQSAGYHYVTNASDITTINAPYSEQPPAQCLFREREGTPPSLALTPT